MTPEAGMGAAALVIVLVCALTLTLRPRQLDTVVRAALEPMVRDVDAIRQRMDEHEERMLRAEVSHKSLDGEIGKRLTELLMQVARIESGMQTRTDYERLHHRINELGKQVSGSMQAITAEISSAQTKAESAITRVTRVEQHLMERHQ